MTSDPWDDIPTSAGGAYYKFESPGDSVSGTILAKRAGTDFDNNPCPELDVETADGVTATVSAGQAQLKRLLMDANPQVGDRISMIYTGDEKNARGFSMKCFDVAVKTGAGDGAAPVAAAAGKPSAADLL